MFTLLFDKDAIVRLADALSLQVIVFLIHPFNFIVHHGIYACCHLGHHLERGYHGIVVA